MPGKDEWSLVSGLQHLVSLMLYLPHLLRDTVLLRSPPGKEHSRLRTRSHSRIHEVSQVP
jgi:hypothetical protein